MIFSFGSSSLFLRLSFHYCCDFNLVSLFKLSSLLALVSPSRTHKRALSRVTPIRMPQTSPHISLPTSSPLAISSPALQTTRSALHLSFHPRTCYWSSPKTHTYPMRQTSSPIFVQTSSQPASPQHLQPTSQFTSPRNVKVLQAPTREAEEEEQQWHVSSAAPHSKSHLPL